MKKIYLFLFCSVFLFSTYLKAQYTLYPGLTEAIRQYEAPYTSTPPAIDGDPSDPVWDLAPWGQVQWVSGTGSSDWPELEKEAHLFSGTADYLLQWKMLWDENTYYLLMKISDDVVVYSDLHNGYSGTGNKYPPVVLQPTLPAVGGGDGSVFHWWRMDNIELYISDTTSAYKTSWNRLNDHWGMWKNVYPGAVTSDSSFAKIMVDRNNVATYGVLQDGTAAGSKVENTIFIEFKDVLWKDMIPTKADFGGKTGAVLLMDMAINETDNITNRRDYALTLGTNGGANLSTSQWISITLTGEPAPKTTVMGVISENDNLTSLVTALDEAGLSGVLEGEGPFTVFAPSNDAFSALPASVLNALMADPPGLLADVLKHHVLGEKILSGSLTNGLELTPVFGEKLTITISGEDILVNDARIIMKDLQADNGVVHIIDAVLIAADPNSVTHGHSGNASFILYPNPNSTGVLQINKVTEVTIFNLMGKQVLKSFNTSHVDISGLTTGVYVVKDAEGNVRKLIRK